MSCTPKTATSSLRLAALSCMASTSRLSPLRTYATEADLPPSTPNEPTFGTTVEEKIEKAEIRRYKGPGFPNIPVRFSSASPRLALLMKPLSPCEI